MLTIYEPEVNTRLSILHCQQLCRPQSARIVRPAPWDLALTLKRGGKFRPKICRSQPVDFANFGSLETQSKEPLKPTGLGGIRTAYARTYSNFAAVSPSQMTWNGGLRVIRHKNQESAPEKRRIGVKAIEVAMNKSSSQVQSSVFTYSKDIPQKPASLRTKRLARRNMSTLSMTHNGGKELRPKCEDISLAAKRINCFERKTTIKRYFKKEAQVQIPYGTERNIEFTPPARRYIHYDTRGLLS